MITQAGVLYNTHNMIHTLYGQSIFFTAVDVNFQGLIFIATVHSYFVEDYQATTGSE